MPNPEASARDPVEVRHIAGFWVRGVDG